MYENGGEITIRGKKYPMLFNVAALKKSAHGTVA